MRCAGLRRRLSKSIIQADIAKSATDKGNAVLFLVHRKELTEQIKHTFTTYGVDMSLCNVAMVQTACRRIQKLTPPKLIITDEAHHSSAASYTKIYEAFENTLRIGFTATPWRLGSGGLDTVFDSMVEGVSTEWLIQNGYLSPYKYYSVKLVNTDKLHRRAGEYIASEVQALMDSRAIYGDVISNYRKLANGKKTIVYCASVKLSKDTAQAFEKHGIPSAHLDGETPKAEREKTIQDFRDGKITVLSNVDLFGEGFDVPDCECVILLRPTLSLTLHIQQSMRSMRFKEGKTAIIIDHVGNVFRHGLPDDKREWTLSGRNKAKVVEKKTPSIRQCGNCFACVPPLVQKCPYCGHDFKPTEREIQEKQAELEEINRDKLKKAKYDSYKNFTTFDELHAFQRARGYKFLWTIRKCIELNIPYPKKYNFVARKFL